MPTDKYLRDTIERLRVELELVTTRLRSIEATLQWLEEQLKRCGE